MYAHHVIDWIDRWGKTDPLKKDKLNKLKNYILNSVQFNLGEFDRVVQFDKKINLNEFVAEYNPFLKIPFDTCWFDWTAGGFRLGLIIRKIDSAVFSHEFIPFGIDPVDKTKWNVTPIVFIEKGWDRYKIYNYFSEEEFKEFDALTHHFIVFFKTILFLNAKNIVYKKIDPPAKLNKKREKKSKTKLFDYHILTINDTLVRTKSTISVNATNKRLHFCRGHFKKYAKEKPLFGKITGLYWWDAHIRGKNKNGFVAKDYKVNHDKHLPGAINA